MLSLLFLHLFLRTQWWLFKPSPNTELPLLLEVRKKCLSPSSPQGPSLILSTSTMPIAYSCKKSGCQTCREITTSKAQGQDVCTSRWGLRDPENGQVGEEMSRVTFHCTIKMEICAKGRVELLKRGCKVFPRWDKEFYCCCFQTSLKYNILPEADGRAPFALQVNTLPLNADKAGDHRTFQVHINVR